MIRIAHSEAHPLQLPAGHRFPGEKYELVRRQLELEGCIRPGQLFHPEFASDSEICLTHDPAYWARIKSLTLTEKEVRKIGFPRSPELYLRSLSSASGTLHAARFALNDGCGMNLAGGTHHAYADRGEGFCVLNDVAIAINALKAEGSIQKALVIDLDVHQGNGTAFIFNENADVFTWSIHCAENYPLRKESSDLDQELPAGTDDVTYLDLLDQTMPQILELYHYDIAFFIAGVDVLAGDKLGKFALSPHGCLLRDKKVISSVNRKGLPLVVVMGGGYHSNLNTLVRAHANTFKIALETYDRSLFFS